MGQKIDQKSSDKKKRALSYTINLQSDLIEEFMKNELDHVIDGFFVAGGSKRGWVTWFTGVVEPQRVIAIAPVVLDILNMHVSLKHSFMSLGNWSFAFEVGCPRHLPEIAFLVKNYCIFVFSRNSGFFL